MPEFARKLYSKKKALGRFLKVSQKDLSKPYSLYLPIIQLKPAVFR
jgi:hypothetical protein